MDYKTIQVHIDATSGAQERVAFAARLAREHDAHLTGLAQTGITRFLYESAVPGNDLSGLAPLFEQLRSEAEARARQFDDAARQAGLASFDHCIGDEEPANALAVHGMYADLAIVGSDPGDAGLPGYVALNAPCPVLVLPRTGAPAAASGEPVFGRILVGWNASPEAARAVRLALPFLVRARDVDASTSSSAYMPMPMPVPAPPTADWTASTWGHSSRDMASGRTSGSGACTATSATPCWTPRRNANPTCSSWGATATRASAKSCWAAPAARYCGARTCPCCWPIERASRRGCRHARQLAGPARNGRTVRAGQSIMRGYSLVATTVKNASTHPWTAKSGTSPNAVGACAIIR
jgi:hypothetical protein